MRCILSGTIIVLILACASAQACTAGPRKYDPAHDIGSKPLSEILERADVIVEGVLAKCDAGSSPAAASDGVRLFRMRVTKVWKGSVGPEIILQVHQFFCPVKMPLGVPVRFAGPVKDGNVLSYGEFPVDTFGLPISDSVVDAALLEFERKHQAE